MYSVASSSGFHWPDIPLLGEEILEDEQLALLEKGRFWCLDPVDGTTNFTTGLPFFVISAPCRKWWISAWIGIRSDAERVFSCESVAGCLAER
ncbi:inositol monophosphatase family protein [Candidatus Vondammii sp. HM_W22]|uniref:inositol monophosphatase family protein n=1 Tax=Candidatus Vondammii sp. HM_W22 TaxID=2687299 RepID=UPI002F374F7B